VICGGDLQAVDPVLLLEALPSDVVLFAVRRMTERDAPFIGALHADALVDSAVRELDDDLAVNAEADVIAAAVDFAASLADERLELRIPRVVLFRVSFRPRVSIGSRFLRGGAASVSGLASSPAPLLRVVDLLVYGVVKRGFDAIGTVAVLAALAPFALSHVRVDLPLQHGLCEPHRDTAEAFS
jgi:hypothetical protein